MTFLAEIFPDGRADLWHLTNDLLRYQQNAISDADSIAQEFSKFLGEYSDYYESVDDLDEGSIEFDMYQKDLQLSARGHLVSFYLLLESILRNAHAVLKLKDGFAMRSTIQSLSKRKFITVNASELMRLGWDIRNVIVHHNGGLLVGDNPESKVAKHNKARNQRIITAVEKGDWSGLSLKDKVLPWANGETGTIVLVNAEFVANLIKRAEPELVELHKSIPLNYSDWFW